jgi:hypothetical protein
VPGRGTTSRRCSSARYVAQQGTGGPPLHGPHRRVGWPQPLVARFSRSELRRATASGSDARSVRRPPAPRRTRPARATPSRRVGQGRDNEDEVEGDQAAEEDSPGSTPGRAAEDFPAHQPRLGEQTEPRSIWLLVKSQPRLTRGVTRFVMRVVPASVSAQSPRKRDRGTIDELCGLGAARAGPASGAADILSGHLKLATALEADYTRSDPLVNPLHRPVVPITISPTRSLPTSA